MKKYKFGLFALLFVLGLFVFNTNASAVTVSPSDCAINSTLRIGSTGSEVTCLQTRLGLSADGKFGPKTRAAVISFQSNYGLTTDGIVGARSRAIFSGNDTIPKNLPDGCTSIFGYSATTGKSCGTTTIPLPGYQSPVISGVSGPQYLNVNGTGTWTVKAYDKNGGDLSYAVVWGDEIYASLLLDPSSGKRPIAQQSATFTHSYSQAGNYTPRFTVTNSNGQSAQASLEVRVGNGETPPDSPITVLSPNGGETWVKGTIQKIKWNTSSVSEKATIIINKLNDCVATANTGCATWYSAEVLKINVPNTGSYSWYVPTTFTDGRYILEIEIVDSSGVIQDESDSYFKITSNTTQPSIILTASGRGVSGQNITVDKGSTFSISGTPKNLGLGYSRAFFFDQNFGDANSCRNNSTNDLVWIMTCGPANTIGSSYFYVEIYQNGKTYKSNIVTVNVSDSVTSSITVLSPNGGETWVKGTTQKIKWDDVSNVKYDIKLISYYAPCISNSCPMVYHMPYTIASDVYGNSSDGHSYFYWMVGSGPGFDTVPEGSYTIQVCRTNSSVCDSTDSYFKIVKALPIIQPPVPSSPVTIISILPAGCSSTAGYSYVNGVSCASDRYSAEFGDTVYLYGSNFYSNSGGYVATYSSTTGNLIKMPTNFHSSSLISFVVSASAGDGNHGLTYSQVIDGASKSNTVSLNFVDSTLIGTPPVLIPL